MMDAGWEGNKDMQMIHSQALGEQVGACRWLFIDGRRQKAAKFQEKGKNVALDTAFTSPVALQMMGRQLDMSV